jgi:cyclohexa-1,5-dienecarbonyl-CoA hydratase
MHEIAAAVEIAGSNPQGKAILFCAEGDHFSFGASVPEHRAEVVAEMLTAFHALFRTLIASSLPTVSAVRGQCLGGGFELVAFTHWVFASPDACFGQPEVNLGVFPPVASLILPFRVGQTAADDLTLTGRSWAAEELKQKGFLHAVTDRPEEAAREFIQKHLVPKSAVALRYTVRSSRWAMHEAVLKHISALEKMYIDELMKSHDANEGIKAFMEKRPPIWKNQ